MVTELDFQLEKITNSVKEYLDYNNFSRIGLETFVLAHNGKWFKITVEEENIEDNNGQ